MPPDKKVGPAGNGTDSGDLLAGAEIEADSTDLERATIGALLLGDDTVRGEILAVVADDDFADPRCRFVAGVIRQMAAAGMPVDTLTVSAHVASHALLSPGPRRVLASDLFALAAAAPVPASGGWYAVAVLEAAVRRQVRAAALRVVEAADGGSLDDLRAATVRELLAAATAISRALSAVVT